MGRKRATSARLTRAYATASSSSSSSATVGLSHAHSPLTVADKLSKLRLEGIQHERNIAGTSVKSLVGVPSHNSRPLQITPDVSQLLGQHYIEPQSRIKPRNRGHLAPRSWNEHLTKRTLLHNVHHGHGLLHRGRMTLVDQCLHEITRDIVSYMDSGMNFLPGYIKAQLLASLTSEQDDVVWHDILPEEDDDIHAVDLSLTRPPIKCLRRLTAVRSVTLSVAQVESIMISALPSVLQELIIRPLSDMFNTQPAQRAYWRRLSSHFIALKVIRLDLQYLDIHNLSAIDIILGALLEGPDWREAFETVDEIVVVARSDDDAAFLSSSVPIFGFRSSLRKLRRRGRHVECRVTACNATERYA